MKPGTITIADRKIMITCQPHVAIMLRRVFGGVRRKGAGSFEMSATPTNANLLEWFRAQFPLDLEPGGEATFRELVATEKLKQSAIAELEEPGYVPRSFKLALPAREYQRVAADLALRTGALLIGDAIGCGKTCTAICALIERLPAIVVTMTQLPAQWQREFAKFAPGIRVHVIETTKPYDLTRIRRERDPNGKLCPAPPGLPDVVAISYSKIDGWADTLAAYGRAVCFDEIQELRHGDTNKYRAACAIAGAMQLKIGASATPMFNYGSEIYPVLKVIAPDSLGTREEFFQEWCGGGGGDPSKVCVKDPVALGTYLRESGLLIRRTRKDIGRELPPLSIVRHVVECDHRRIDEAEADVAELARRVLARTGTNLERMQWAGEIDLRMRQATGIGKAPAVADFVRLLVESDETVVLFGWHRSCHDIWQSALERAGIKYAMYTGSESVAAKADGVRRFTRGEARVLIMSLRSGAGVDGLQHGCCTTVHGELDWSPKVIEQCVDYETEILTHRGFMGPMDIKDDDHVAGLDITSGRVSWLPILSRVDRALAEQEKMFAINQPSINVRVTGGHRMLYQRRGQGQGRPWYGIEVIEAEKLAGRNRGYRIPVAGMMDSVGVPLTDDQLRVLGWFVTDGSFNPKRGQLTFSQAKASPFNDELRAALRGAGLHWTECEQMTQSNFIRRSPLIRYTVPRFGAKKRSTPGNGWQTLAPWIDKNLAPGLMSMTEHQLGVFLEAVHMGDGAKMANVSWTRRGYSISCGNRTFADRLQILCVLRGWRCGIYPVKTKFYRHWTIGIKKDSTRSIAGTSAEHSGLVQVPSRDGERVWCVENALGTIITRRRGTVAVLGNCIGRIARDGQPNPVAAYLLVAESGSDPAIEDVLGLKDAQSSAIMDPDLAGVAQLVGSADDRIRRLAEDILRRRGKKVDSTRHREIA